MSKFWAFAAILVLIGILAAIAAYSMEDEITFTDLETECREDRTEAHQVSVDQNELKFSGHFPLQSTRADLNYDYHRSGDRIVLNIKYADQEPPEDFERDCYATGVYKAETVSYEGRYMVVTELNGEVIDKRVINFR